MTSPLIRQLPNVITTLRLLLALPICIFILQERYEAVWWLAVVAGFSDAVDGWWARKLDARSRYGAVVDPLSDKALLVGAFISLAVVGAIPVGLAVVVVARDLVILTGALSYHFLFGQFRMAPSLWGKSSTLVQIAFVLMVLTHKVYPVFPPFLFELGILLVLALALISGGNYVVVWSKKAWAESRKA